MSGAGFPSTRDWHSGESLMKGHRRGWGFGALLLWGKSQNLGLFSLEKGQDTVSFWWWSLTKLRGNEQYCKTEDSFGTSGNPILLWEWLTYCHRLPREIICFPSWTWFWATSIRYLWLRRFLPNSTTPCFWDFRFILLQILILIWIFTNR